MQTDVLTKDLDAPRVYPNPDVLGVSPELEPELLKIEYWPNDVLHQKCEDVTDFDEKLHQLIYDMSYTMYRRDGVGLAAPQVGVLLNVIIVETNLAMIPMVNPRIIESSDTLYEFEEGCLSVPGYYEKRKRSQRVIIEYQTSNGIKVQKEFQGLAAFAVQHEIDHLEGKVFVDGLSRLKQDRVKKKIKKFRR